MLTLSIVHEEQAVIIVLQIPAEIDDLEFVDSIEEHISDAITAAQAGNLDGNEVGEGTLTLFIYGRSAERIVDVVVPLLGKFRNTGSYAIKRKGPPGAAEERTML